MISSYRDSFNNNFSKEKYTALIEKLADGFVSIPFRVAETPVFIPSVLKDKLVAAGEEIISLIKKDNFKSLTEKAIPPQWNVPGESAHPHFLTFDFGICKNKDGELSPMLIELQGFPSLYGFQEHLANSYQEVFDLPEILSPFFHSMKKSEYINLLKEVIVGPYDPQEVALMDINANQQKTAIDFLITAKHLGIQVLSLQDIKKEGKNLYYLNDGRKIILKRIYNRLIFDEIAHQTDLFSNSFDPREELDVEWITHPNWFYRISKYTLPFLNSDFVPPTYFLDKLDAIPEDLEHYVLKPLFSFAGNGVVIDVKREDLDKITDPENWILQRKVDYAPVVKSPDGDVKVEIRLMYLWPEGKEPVLCINLARLSKGKMIGVSYNHDFDWVGGSVGLMEVPKDMKK